MRADLHVHSTYSSDGKQSVAEILERCRELGLAAVAISDHNALKAAEEARTIDGHGIIVIPAIEITSSEGHILALGVKKMVPQGMSVKETIELVHQAGGIAVAAHPYRLWSGLGEKNVVGQGFDAIETMNGRSLKGGNARAKRLAQELRLPGMGGSDAHNAPAVGRAYTVLPDSCRTVDDIIEAIRKGEGRAEGASKPKVKSFALSLKSVFRWLRRGLKRI
jgi:predicted metal-dependent phosphoesterase TrpH